MSDGFACHDSEYLPCPPMQAGLVFETLARGSDHYLQQVLITLREPVSVAWLREAWAAAITRHETLRIEFLLRTARTPGMRICQSAAMEIQEHDWSEAGTGEGECRWQALIAADRAAGIALDRAPLMRLALCRLRSGQTRLLWTYHHALLDGRSRVRVLQEVFSAGAKIPAGAAFRPYAEWAHAESIGGEARDFWRGLLGDADAATPPPPSLSPEGDPTGPPGFGARVLTRGASDGLRNLAQARGLSLGDLVQSAFVVLLAQEVAEADLLFAGTRAARRSPPFPTEGIVGLLMVTLPVRVRVDQTRPFVDVMRGLRELSGRMRPFEHSPLVDLRRESGIPAGQPLAETMFSFEHATTGQALRQLDPAWEKRDVEVLERPGYGLMIKAYGDPAVVVSANWDGTSCRPAAGERFLDRLVGLLNEIVETGLDQRVGRLARMSDAECRELSGGRDSPLVLSRDDLVPMRIAAAIDRHPERVALSHRDERMTYGRLGQRSAQLAGRLVELGVRPGDRVGIATTRTPDMVAAILAVHGVGAAFVPIDPGYPSERISFMTVDGDLRALVADRTSIAGLPEIERPVLLVEDVDAAERPDAPLEHHQLRMTDISHVIYTSGSTGQPKGVMIGHDAVAALTVWAAETFTEAHRDGVLASTSLSFDLSVFEVLVTLALGGRVVLVEDLSEVLRPGFCEHVAHVNTVPSVAANLLRDRELPETVRVVTFCGEVLERDLVRRIARSPGVEQIWNLYGPSEDTTFSTAALCDPKLGGDVSIGRPIPGTQAYVLNAALQPVAVGMRGEIFLGGAGLARGYLGRPELTAERFIVNPLDGAPSERLYRTGDMGAWHVDGTLRFHGRRDGQIKLRGFRIELGEVRQAVLADRRLSDATVVVREVGGRDSLVAYVVPSAGIAIDAAEIRRAVASRLPDHAVPAAIVALDSLPLTPSGKLDRAALPGPSLPRASSPATRGLERELAGIWQDLLELDRPPSLGDDFFSSGGDSLDALRLMVTIEERYDVRMPAFLMLGAATLRAMAAAIAAEQESADERLAPLAIGGSKAPWFCVLANHEQALGLRRELPRVIGNRNAYSLAVLPPALSLEDFNIGALATIGLKALVAEQPNGPYLIGGYSVGGAVAWEMACRLTAAGSEVALVTIIDSQAPHEWRWHREVRRRRRALSTRGPRGKLRGYVGIALISARTAHGWFASFGRKHASMAASELSLNAIRTLIATYRAPDFSRPVLVLETQAEGREEGTTLGWERHARGPLTTRRVDGNHLTVISADNAATFSTALCAELDRTGV